MSKRIQWLRIVLFGALAFVAACGSNAPEHVAQQFITHLQKREISSAMELVSKESRSALGDAKLRSNLAQASEASEMRYFSHASAGDSAVSSDGRSATVKLISKDGDREWKMGDAHLLKEGGDWKIDLSDMVQ